MAYQETPLRVCVEFQRASQPSIGRVIRLNHNPALVPPQLLSRLHPVYWSEFMRDVGQLSLSHPYSAKPTVKDCCTWAACFGLGYVVGLFCVSPDAGDYGVWEAECRQLVDRWAPGFAQAGCSLSLQRHRDYWIQVDVDPAFPLSQPVAPPLPRMPQQAPAAAAAAGGGQPPADQPPPQYETVGGEAGKPPKAV